LGGKSAVNQLLSQVDIRHCLLPQLFPLQNAAGLNDLGSCPPYPAPGLFNLS
jgi:hypothetical protein